MYLNSAHEARIPAGLIWLDSGHALVAKACRDGMQVIEVDRSFDSEAGYLLRVAEEAATCDRLVVIGPDGPRHAFEQEYVTLCHRPDRLIDAGLELEPLPRELVDRLRFLDLDPPDRD